MDDPMDIDLEHLDYYAILGLTRHASQVDVRRAYKSMALQWHPDKHGGNDERFKKISAAYQVLSDASARQEYDSALDQAQRQQQSYTFTTSPSPNQRHQQQAYDPFATMGMGMDMGMGMGGGMADPFAEFHFAFRAADDVFRSVFGAAIPGFPTAHPPPRAPAHQTPNSPFASMFPPMPPMMMLGMPHLPPMGFNPFAPSPPPSHHHHHLHHHQHHHQHQLQHQHMTQHPTTPSSRASISISTTSGTGFYSTSKSRAVDHAGNVIEETVTVDPNGHRTVTRKVNGVEQPAAAQGQGQGPYQVPVITASSRSGAGGLQQQQQ